MKSPSPYWNARSLKTYGITLGDIFGNVDLSIGTFRWSVSRAIPEMTRVALLTKKDEMVKENPSFAKDKFLYNLKRSEYEKEWGKTYQETWIRRQDHGSDFQDHPESRSV